MSCKLTNLFLCILAASLVHCQKAVPALSAIKSLDGFSLNQNSKSVNTTNSPIAVSGQCDSKFSDVSVSFDQGISWRSISQYDSAAMIDCKTTGSFSANLSLSTYSDLISKFQSARKLGIKLRGESEYGPSVVSDLALSLVGAGGANRLVAGSNSTTSGQYNLTGRLVSPSTSAVTTGYKLTGRVTPRY